MRYTVTNTIQSGDTTNPPATVQWYKGTDLASAIVAMGQAALHNSREDSNLPESMRFRVLDVHLDVADIYKVGDPDPTPNDGTTCGAASPRSFGCTWTEGHRGDHVAADGTTICDVWPQR